MSTAHVPGWQRPLALALLDGPGIRPAWLIIAGDFIVGALLQPADQVDHGQGPGDGQQAHPDENGEEPVWPFGSHDPPPLVAGRTLGAGCLTKAYRAAL